MLEQTSSNWVSQSGLDSLFQLLTTQSGMLSSAETIDVIAETLQAHKVPVIVLDPVQCIHPFNLFYTKPSR